jgi:chromate transporter
MKELSYIFVTFLKLGATAFGGYMSLVALVQKQVVDIDKKLEEEDLLNGISLASVLPGPFAVNVCTYIGYRLKGLAGAVAAFTGLILPSFLMVVVLSYFYFTYGDVPAVKRLFGGITPAIIALIIAVGIGMAHKNIKDSLQGGLCLVAAVLLVFVGGFWVTCLLIAGSGLAGFLIYRGKESGRPGLPVGEVLRRNRRVMLAGAALLLLFIVIAWYGRRPDAPLQVKLLSSFSGVSLTLFGGGYVVIPALYELFVENLGWLTAAEFTDGIAIGQVTPGPIFITAAFIGYKVQALAGAALATIGMFTPPAVLTVVFSCFVDAFIHSPGIRAAMKGVRPAVIGMIFASAVVLGKGMTFSLPVLVIFMAVLLLSFLYNISPVSLIVGAGVAGLIII